MTARYRDWVNDYYRDDEHAFSDCCGAPRDGDCKPSCVMHPQPRVSVEGDRVDHEQDSVGMFDRPWLPSGDLVGDHRRELPLEGPDWDFDGLRRLP